MAKVSLTVRQKLQDIGWGIQRGLAFAAAYAVFAAIISTINPEAFIENDTSLGEVLVIYAIAGVLGGAVIGAARTRLERKKTAYAPAVVAMTIALFSTFIILEGHPRGWTGAEWFAVLFGGPLFGLLGVHSIWRETGRPD